ncbi:4Fe-4S binding protein [Candidatus Allofournierella excrementigallinarum]|uniref:4Fe-4S binding protein n=1 Tax=Candidatus Allofournierella excrementigallinarum TaxID=2838592 RepID=UPI00374E53DF
MSPIKAVKAAYFSPSGGTKRAAMLLCGQFGLPAEPIDCTCPPAKLPAVIPVAKDELLVLALPVYGGFGPRVEGLFSQLRGQGGPCVILTAYGNRDYENALAAAARQMTEQGFVCVGGIAPITPHVFAPSLGAGRPDKEDMPAFAAFAKKVLAACESEPLRPAALPGDANAPRKPLRPIGRSRDKERCNHCGRCVRACPAGALNELLEVDGAKCVNCLVCRFSCPTYAWQFDTSQTKAWLEENFSARRAVEWFAE